MNTYQDLTHTQSFIICAFYTPNYHENALRLKESIERFSINFHIREVKDRGYWEANTRIKPEFLLECLERFPEQNILYIDTDACIKNELSFFDTIQEDICIYDTQLAPGMSHQYLASTIFLKNTPNTKELVRQWIANQTGGITMVDQDSLDKAMLQMKGPISIKPLPEGYIKIFDRNHYQGTVYIEQYQASRQMPKLRRRLIRLRNAGLILLLVFLIGLTAHAFLS